MGLIPTKNQFNVYLGTLLGELPAIRAERKTAFNKLLAIGLPSKRDEYWQYTDLAKIFSTEFNLAKDHSPEIDKNLIAKYFIEDSYRIVTINGKINSTLSDFETIANHLAIDNQTGNKIYDTATLNPFVYMNNALFNGSYTIDIASNVVIDKPLHILNMIIDENDFVQHHHNYLINIGKNSQVAIVEENVNLNTSDSFVNTILKLQLEENCTVSRTIIRQNHSNEHSYQYSSIEQKNDSSYKSQLINIGGAFVRNDIDIQLNGENCETDISSLTLLSKQDHIENYLFLNHNKPQSNSSQLFKYILNDKSEGVFNGLVKVNSEAQKTNSQQSNKNILLSKNALMNSNPQLEIYADDVKCSHGSATGELEEDAIFYLRSRGIDLATAKSLLIDGFANEIIEKVEIDSVKERLNSLLQMWQDK